MTTPAAVIIRRGAAYCGGAGYCGPACVRVAGGVEYDRVEDAREDAAMLTEDAAHVEAYRGWAIEFVVVRWRERRNCPECGCETIVTRRGWECVKTECGLVTRYEKG